MDNERIELAKLFLNHAEDLDTAILELSPSAKHLLILCAEVLQENFGVCEKELVEKSDPVKEIVDLLLKGEELELSDDMIDKVIDYVEENLENFYIRVVNNKVSLNPQVKHKAVTRKDTIGVPECKDTCTCDHDVDKHPKCTKEDLEVCNVALEELLTKLFGK